MMRYVFNAIQEVGTFSQCEPLITVTAIKKKHWNYDEFIIMQAKENKGIYKANVILFNLIMN